MAERHATCLLRGESSLPSNVDTLSASPPRGQANHRRHHYRDDDAAADFPRAAAATSRAHQRFSTF